MGEGQLDAQLLHASDGSYGACGEPPRVRIARIGELPHGGSSKLSRDGSVHVTDEARMAPSALPRSPALTRAGRRRCSTPRAT